MKVTTTITRIVLVAAVLSLLATAAMAQGNDLAVGKAKDFITLLSKGDFNGAYAKVDSNLGFKSTPDTYKTVWQNLISKAGNFVEFKEATVENKGGVMIVTQVAKFEKGHVDLKVAIDNSLKVADFLITNHKAAPKQAAGGGGASPSNPQDQTAAGGGASPSSPQAQAPATASAPAN